MRRSVITEIACISFILLFGYAAASKLLAYEKFRVQLGQSRLLTAYAPWIAPGIPVIEILLSILLIIPRWKLLSLYLSLWLMATFTAYIYSLLYLSDAPPPCSCGGVLQQLSWTQHLWFNLFFLLIAIAGILLYKKQPSNHQLTN